MAFKKKTWKDRLVEYAGRRQFKRVSGDPNGTMIADVTRYEGTVSQAGDAFSAANMNDLEQRIADEFSLVSSNLSELLAVQQASITNNNYAYSYLYDSRITKNSIVIVNMQQPSDNNTIMAVDSDNGKAVIWLKAAGTVTYRVNYIVINL